MITALKLGNNTILIHYDECPIRREGKFVPIEGNENLIEMYHAIDAIQMVIPDDEGTGARIIPISFSDIKKIHDTAEAIRNEIPAPGNPSDYDY